MISLGIVIGVVIGITGTIVYQIATPGNEEKQVRALVKRMKKATLAEKSKLKTRVNALIDKV